MAQESTKQQKEILQKSKIAEREEEILQWWREKDIFQKTLDKKAPNGEFVFYDGPPFATGLPHYGHILQGMIKDYIGRYQTMKGKHVARRWGWDCHGLPIENIVEKEIGLKSKKEIENFGIEKFNDIARTKIFAYADDWKKVMPRMGRFVDMDNDYRTMNPTFMESVWWVFKELHTRGLVYEGFKSMHLCPHCGTTLSNFEVSQGYKDIADISVIAKFKLLNEPDTYFLAWTTTPWTLPGNVALAVNPNVAYVKVKIGDSIYILAEARLGVVKEAHEIIERLSGEALIGIAYHPVFNYYYHDGLEHKEHGFKVYGASFVTTEDGTGIVHIAPAFGEDDMNLGREYHLPFIQHVGIDGKFTADVKDFAGMSVKPIENPQSTDIEIIKYLAGKGTLFAKEKFTHSYPHCYRCDTPLLNYATNSWFIAVTALKERMKEANTHIHWIPKEIGSGRFANIIETAPDWAISRPRFWGTPMPVWKCEQCERKEYIGSVDEIKKHTKSDNTFLVVRHGEAENNILGILSSNPDTPHHLTEKGRHQAEQASLNLKGKKVDVIYCSPFLRTKETAEIIAERIGYPKENIVFDARLHEIFGGEFDGKTDAEYQAYFATREEKFTKTPNHGENYTIVKNRMTDFLYDIDETHTGKTILIVSHNTPIWLMFSGAAGLNQQETIATRPQGTAFIENSEIRELPFAPIPHNRSYELDLHRPFIDEVVLPCTCGGSMKRISEVFDCWLESGSMPYAQVHYPFENTTIFDPKKNIGFPADFIAEGVDQTRCWFYVMLVLSIALFDKVSYTNVIASGIVLTEDGQKMSKRLENYPDPMDTVSIYSADALRYYLLSSPTMKAEEFTFSNRGVDEIVKKIITRLQNVYSFFEMYGGFDVPEQAWFSENVLDQWIIARLKETETAITVATDQYELDRATWPIVDFVDDVSTWFLRRSRNRFKSEDVKDRIAAISTTRTIILEFSKLLAPSMPFIAEDLYLKITGGMQQESVHLENWPHQFVGPLSLKEQEILAFMKETRRIVSVGLEARAKAGIKVRQPLQSITVQSSMIQNAPAYHGLIQDELNIKEIIWNQSILESVTLDTTISRDLREEGIMRDLTRIIQELRKNNKLNPQDIVTLSIHTDTVGTDIVNRFFSEIMGSTGLKDIIFEEIRDAELFEFENVPFRIALK